MNDTTIAPQIHLTEEEAQERVAKAVALFKEGYNLSLIHI